jgi:hypothetical protein
VPEQQNLLLTSVALPPVVPIFTGRACARCWSFGKGVPLGVGVGVALELELELPPQATRKISKAKTQNPLSVVMA